LRFVKQFTEISVKINIGQEKIMSEQESSTIPPLFNRIMGAMLRSPLHRMASRSILLITFTGRKTGRRYTTPISYLREGDKVTAFTGAKWSRNLVGGAPVTLNIKNKDYQATADVVEDKEAVAESLRSFLNQVRSDARFYQVKFDDDGQPNWQDVQRAAQRCVMLRMQLNGQLGSS
jgi:deazaflavin-dependent oxidoreductase (nitroreductase family)